jgi:hypothetical protein
MRIIIESQDTPQSFIQPSPTPDRMGDIDAGSPSASLLQFLGTQTSKIPSAAPVSAMNGGTPPQGLLDAIAEAASPATSTTSNAINIGPAPTL